MEDIENKQKDRRMPVSYEYFMTYQGRSYSGICRDISTRGVAIFTDEFLTPGEKVELTLVIEDLNINFHLKGEINYCRSNKNNPDVSHEYLADIEFTDGHEQGLPFIGGDQVSHHAPSQTISIDTDAKRCYELMTDFERYPEWSKGIKGMRILERYPNGRAKVVEFEYNIFIRTVRFANDYFYDDNNNSLSWTGAGGDKEILSHKGRYSFRQLSKGKTSATFQAEITLSFVPSGRIVKYFSSVLMRKEMKNFKKYAEGKKD